MKLPGIVRLVTDSHTDTSPRIVLAHVAAVFSKLLCLFLVRLVVSWVSITAREAAWTNQIFQFKKKKKWRLYLSSQKRNVMLLHCLLLCWWDHWCLDWSLWLFRCLILMDFHCYKTLLQATEISSRDVRSLIYIFANYLQKRKMQHTKKACHRYLKTVYWRFLLT